MNMNNDFVWVSLDAESKAKPSFTWIKYANDDKGTGMSDKPTKTSNYLGLKSNNDKDQASDVKANDPSQYDWVRIVSEAGYTWVAYGSEHEMSLTEERFGSSTHMFIAYNKPKPMPSMSSGIIHRHEFDIVLPLEGNKPLVRTPTLLMNFRHHDLTKSSTNFKRKVTDIHYTRKGSMAGLLHGKQFYLVGDNHIPEHEISYDDHGFGNAINLHHRQAGIVFHDSYSNHLAPRDNSKIAHNYISFTHSANAKAKLSEVELTEDDPVISTGISKSKFKYPNLKVELNPFFTDGKEATFTLHPQHIADITAKSNTTYLAVSFYMDKYIRQLLHNGVFTQGNVDLEITISGLNNTGEAKILYEYKKVGNGVTPVETVTITDSPDKKIQGTSEYCALEPVKGNTYRIGALFDTSALKRANPSQYETLAAIKVKVKLLTEHVGQNGYKPDKREFDFYGFQASVSNSHMPYNFYRNVVGYTKLEAKLDTPIYLTSAKSFTIKTSLKLDPLKRSDGHTLYEIKNEDNNSVLMRLAIKSDKFEFSFNHTEVERHNVKVLYVENDNFDKHKSSNYYLELNYNSKTREFTFKVTKRILEKDPVEITKTVTHKITQDFVVERLTQVEIDSEYSGITYRLDELSVYYPED